MKISIPCADGTDRHCYKVIGTTLPFPMLEEHMVTVYEDNPKNVIIEIAPSPDWMKRFAKDYLTAYQIECVTSDGYFEYDPEESVCDACGSDQDYDDEGNNITGL
ncbi:hypothetical protein GTP41_20120 [Pseudoduganella sp. DS3]|uniref:Uncharacterized protein n=1 Tax=Pseudoduganella guangdongensis TaxID=2692179 RepID=A0A6N9HMI7_9BURK|nr:hypothetical protein [Pseudoduganella guangdongensis]MYN04403.1 hypothetical protein [Pseudoduganella guangdongensis]